MHRPHPLQPPEAPLRALPRCSPAWLHPEPAAGAKRGRGCRARVAEGPWGSPQPYRGLPTNPPAGSGSAAATAAGPRSVPGKRKRRRQPRGARWRGGGTAAGPGEGALCSPPDPQPQEGLVGVRAVPPPVLSGPGFGGQRGVARGARQPQGTHGASLWPAGMGDEPHAATASLISRPKDNRHGHGRVLLASRREGT